MTAHTHRVISDISMAAGSAGPWELDLPCADTDCIVARVERLAGEFEDAERVDGRVEHAARRLRELLSPPKEGP